QSGMQTASETSSECGTLPGSNRPEEWVMPQLSPQRHPPLVLDCWAEASTHAGEGTCAEWEAARGRFHFRPFHGERARNRLDGNGNSTMNAPTAHELLNDPAVQLAFGTGLE